MQTGELATRAFVGAGVARLDLNDIPVAARIIDPETLRYVAVNRASCELYGYSPSEFLQMNVEELVPADQLEAVGVRLQHGSASARQGLWQHRTRDGRILDVEVTTSSIEYLGRQMMLAICVDRTAEVRSARQTEEAQRRMVAVTEGVRDALFLLDEEFRFTYVNRNCFPTMRQAPAELLGKELWSELPLHWDDWCFPLFRKVMSDRIPMHFEVRGLGEAGGSDESSEPERWYEVDVFPAAGGIGVAYRDITDRRREDERRAFLMDLSDRIRTMPDPSQVVDAVVASIGEFLGANRASYGEFDDAGEIVTIERDYFEGVLSLTGSVNIRGFGSFVQDLCAGRSVVIHDVADDPRTAGHLLQFQAIQTASVVVVPLIRSGRLVAALAVHSKLPHEWNVQDVALLETVAQRAWHAVEHARADRNLQRLNEELESRVRERTAELQAAKDDMEGFCYSVSHDLRTPLRAMMASARILLEDNAEQLDEAGAEQLQRLSRASKRMGDLIDDLLQFSRLGRKALECSEVNLSGIAEQLAGDLLVRHRERRIEFEIAPDLIATGDEKMLFLALQNLLENAVKFSRDVEVARIEFGRSDDTFFVRDNGAGFDSAYAHKLFRPFERLHRDDEYPGTGIGLANVARVVERHGGSIRAESVLGEGATFWFTLG